MAKRIGYVVLECHPASGRTHVYGGEILPTPEEAEEYATAARRVLRFGPHRDRFSVASVTIEDDEE